MNKKTTLSGAAIITLKPPKVLLPAEVISHEHRDIPKSVDFLTNTHL
ncbi:hypothetical protein [Paenibacillus pseudetheri]|nr:hypothetical protein [Paenibacillus pseudetheri]